MFPAPELRGYDFITLIIYGILYFDNFNSCESYRPWAPARDDHSSAPPNGLRTAPIVNEGVSQMQENKKQKKKPK